MGYNNTNDATAVSAGENPSVVDRLARYPWRLLLESYVLACIGRLLIEQDRMLGELLRSVDPVAGDWRAVVRSALGVDRTADAKLARLWICTLEAAGRRSSSVCSLRFSEEMARALARESLRGPRKGREGQDRASTSAEQERPALR